VTFVSLQSLRFVLSTDYPIVVVEGVSMEKTYIQGDLLFLKGIPALDIKMGDVVVYRRTAGSLLIVHRVVDIKVVNGEVYFTTQGDNRVTNPYPDSPNVPSTAVVGTVMYHVPALGNVVLALQSPVGLALSVGLIIIILLLDVLNGEEKKPKTSDAL
jgi:signal peptidase